MNERIPGKANQQGRLVKFNPRNDKTVDRFICRQWLHWLALPGG